MESQKTVSKATELEDLLNSFSEHNNRIENLIFRVSTLDKKLYNEPTPISDSTCREDDKPSYGILNSLSIECNRYHTLNNQLEDIIVRLENKI